MILPIYNLPTNLNCLNNYSIHKATIQNTLKNSEYECKSQTIKRLNKNFFVRVVDDKNQKTTLDNFCLKIFWDFVSGVWKISFKKQSFLDFYNSFEISVNGSKFKQIFFNNEIKKNSNCYIENSFYSNDLAKEYKINSLKTLEINLFPLHNSKLKFKKIIIINNGDFNFDKNIQLNNSNSISFYVQCGFLINQFNDFFDLSNIINISFFDLMQGKNNKNIFSVNIKKFDSFTRNKINIEKIYNLPVSKKSNKYLDFNLNTDENNNKNFVGKIEENTYYDLENEETINGFGDFSQDGYVIPYKYCGMFYPYIILDLDTFKNIKISWTVFIKKPYFDDNSNSLIRLKINSVNEWINDNNWNLMNFNELKY